MYVYVKDTWLIRPGLDTEHYNGYPANLYESSTDSSTNSTTTN